MSSFFDQFKEEFKFQLKKELDPIIQRITNIEVEIQNKCPIDDVKLYKKYKISAKIFLLTLQQN